MKSLKTLYDQSSVPTSLPPGKYRVVAFKGVPKLPWHSKTVDSHADWQDGYNRSVIKWGSFYIISAQHCLGLMYYSGKIHDRIREVSEGVYIGKYYRKAFKGYFMLVKEGE